MFCRGERHLERATHNAFARKELHPLARRMDDEEWWPADAFRLIGRNGFLGVTAPASFEHFVGYPAVAFTFAPASTRENAIWSRMTCRVPHVT